MTPEAAKASYRRELKDIVTVRRYAGAGQNRPYFDVEAHARVIGYQPHELVAGILQGDRKAILLVEDLINAQFQLPLRPTDRIVIRGQECAIEAADDSTRRVEGELIAYELRVRG